MVDRDLVNFRLADMINRPDPSNSPDPKMSTAERPILVEGRSSASPVWSLWALSELTSEGPLRFPNYWSAWKVRAKKSLTAQEAIHDTHAYLLRVQWMTRPVIAS
jgi:hypothetical protein